MQMKSCNRIILIFYCKNPGTYVVNTSLTVLAPLIFICSLVMMETDTGCFFASLMTLFCDRDSFFSANILKTQLKDAINFLLQ